MPLSLEELQEIQSELLADDIAIDLHKMSGWTREQAVAYFETGEEPRPFQAEPYLMSRLEKEGLAHLKESLKEQTVAGLVELIRHDRPKFLPTLQKLGVAKLADRQKVRDVINFIANPPVGSEDKLREEHKEELAEWPYAVVQGEKYIATAEVDSMVAALPEGRTFRKYRVRALAREVSGVQIEQRRAAGSTILMGGATCDNGEVILGDEESWSVADPNLRVHVYVPNKVQPSMGYLQGWVNYMDLLPLDEDGNPPVRARVSDFKIQRQIQDYFEDGYYQLSVCRAIKKGIKEKPDAMTFRQALDLVYMKVRGPALIKLGYEPSNKGLAEYMASVDSDYSGLNDSDYAALINAHNRIVALMGGQDPRLVQDALAMRSSGQEVNIGSAFEAEPEPEPIEQPGASDGEAKEQGADSTAEAGAPATTRE
ncbi:hypothetical protein AB1Y20_013147 [Prymnesium parvum]|uniref:RNA-directed RNA polymerase n=1 Tax=Prymnesium parvum TaxID=97485 RepID=A0AB34IKE3_PRYPA